MLSRYNPKPLLRFAFLTTEPILNCRERSFPRCLSWGWDRDSRLIRKSRSRRGLGKAEGLYLNTRLFGKVKVTLPCDVGKGKVVGCGVKVLEIKSEFLEVLEDI